jgi:hypothetical protein
MQLTEQGRPAASIAAGRPLEVRIWGEAKREWVRIWVEDNGVGIPESMLPRVFNMFVRGTSRQTGTGIGLALVRKVVQKMKGHVGVESKVGEGSRFWVELERAEFLTIQSGGTGEVDTGGEGGIVLYVEDEEFDFSFMENAFRESGLEGKLRWAEGGAEITGESASIHQEGPLREDCSRETALRSSRPGQRPATINRSQAFMARQWI